MARAVSPLRDPVSLAGLACATAVWASRHLDGRAGWHATSQHAADLATACVDAFKNSAFNADRLQPMQVYVRALRPLLGDESIPSSDRLIAYAIYNAVASLSLLAVFRPTEARHAAYLALAYSHEMATARQLNPAGLSELFSRYGVSLPPLDGDEPAASLNGVADSDRTLV
jgi:hypothetical protein